MAQSHSRLWHETRVSGQHTMRSPRKEQSPPRTRTLRIGAGASYAGDRVEPATELAARGKLDYLVYETLAERTIALAQLERRKNPQNGYNELLADRFYSVLPHCKNNGTRVVTNMGDGSFAKDDSCAC